MGIYAIAAFMSKDNLVGVRLYNTENNKMVDNKTSDVISLYSGGYRFNNIDIVNNQIKFTCGSVSRYPQILSTGEVKNPRSAIVLGVTDSKSYRIINYEAKIAMIPEETAIQYGNTYGFANCKLINKNDTYIIQSIQGNIPKLNSELKMSINRVGGLNITLPEDGSVTEIMIPNFVCGLRLKHIELITFKPQGLASKIKKLTLGSDYSYIDKSVVGNFVALETLVLESNHVILEQRVFAHSNTLKHVYCNGVMQIMADAFLNCTNLETFKSNSQIGSISPGAFKNCPKLDIESLLECGASKISGRVFENSPIESIRIPPSVKEINLTAFDRCKNLKEIYIESNVTLVDSSIPNINKNNHLTIYLNEGHPSARLLSVGLDLFDNIEIKSFSLMESDPKKGKLLLKSKLSGMKTDSSDLIVNDLDTIKTVIQGSSQEEFEKFIFGALKDGISSRYILHRSSRELHNYVVKYGLMLERWILLKNLCNVNGRAEDALFFGRNSSYAIYLTNKDYYIDIIESKNYFKNNTTRVYRSTKDFIIYPLVIENRGRIDHINYDDKSHTVSVQFRNKYIETIQL